MAAVPQCPQCGGAAAVMPAASGFALEEVFRTAQGGEMALGGCVLDRDVPAWYCKRCDFSFQIVSGEPLMH